MTPPALLIWLVVALPVAAEPPMLRPAVPIAANGAEMDLGSYAIPCVADWNGDGRKDLLAGHRAVDKIAVFLNTGTDTAPVFGPPSLVQANGADIYMPGSGCGAPAPWVCDYNADGLRDLLVGDGSNGTVHFYRNINTNAQPILAADVQLRMGASLLTVSSRATPCVADWDADGLNDLLCGDGNGYVSFYKNDPRMDQRPIAQIYGPRGIFARSNANSPRYRSRLRWQHHHLEPSHVSPNPVLPYSSRAMLEDMLPASSVLTISASCVDSSSIGRQDR